MRLIIWTFIIPLLLTAQKGFISGNIFQTDYFIENKGQFDDQVHSKKPILYSTETEFGNFYFSKDAFILKLAKKKENKKEVEFESEEEREREKR